MSDDRQYLVVMTNNDAYYVSSRAAGLLVNNMERDAHQIRVMDVFDTKTRTQVYIATDKISSVVRLKGNNGSSNGNNNGKGGNNGIAE